jgi:hypothetical protein
VHGMHRQESMSIVYNTTWDDEHGIAHNLKRWPFDNGVNVIVSTRCGLLKARTHAEWQAGRDIREPKDADCMACVVGDEGP